MMSLTEFVTWETLAYKRLWDYRVMKGQVIVTAPDALLLEFGYTD